MSTKPTAAAGLTVAGMIAAAAVAASLISPVASVHGEAQAPEFLQPGRCYRIAFPIEGPPNYKVLELAANGWVRGEVDAGPANAQRQSMWINTAQIVTARETRCSE